MISLFCHKFLQRRFSQLAPAGGGFGTQGLLQAGAVLSADVWDKSGAAKKIEAAFAGVCAVHPGKIATFELWVPTPSFGYGLNNMSVSCSGTEITGVTIIARDGYTEPLNLIVPRRQ